MVLILLFLLVTSSPGVARDPFKKTVPTSGPSRRQNAGLLLSGLLFPAGAVNASKRRIPSGSNPLHN